MIQDDFNDLAALWNTPAQSDEQEELDRLARQTPRRARLIQWGELLTVALVAGAVVVSMALRLGPASLLIGGLLLLLLGWSAWKRHHLRNLALLIDRQDRLTYLRSSVRAKEADLKRSAVGLALILPGTVLAVLLGFSIRGEGDDILAFLVTIWTNERGLISLAILAFAIAVLVRSHLRLSAEVARLRALRDEYAEEAERDALTL